jgi:hypothetical protein
MVERMAQITKLIVLAAEAKILADIIDTMAIMSAFCFGTLPDGRGLLGLSIRSVLISKKSLKTIPAI